MFKIVLLRHGESFWNKENRFTGWTDIDLTENGIYESIEAGKTLKNANFDFDLAYTSILKRGIRTLWHVLEEMDLQWIPVEKNWRLNERHYGALQGLNKSEIAKIHGQEQVLIWRRSYDIRPPALEENDPRYPGSDKRYKDLKKEEIPTTECLKDTVNRVLPYWKKTIAPQVLKGKKVIIVAHGNSLRALMKHLDKISEQDIVNLNIPTGIPLVYELNSKLKPIKHYYIGDQSKIQKKIDSVRNQGKAN